MAEYLHTANDGGIDPRRTNRSQGRAVGSTRVCRPTERRAQGDPLFGRSRRMPGPPHGWGVFAEGNDDLVDKLGVRIDREMRLIALEAPGLAVARQ